MKRNIVIATVAAAAVVCGGTAVAFADDDGGRTERTAVRDVRDAKVTAAQAIDAALKAQPGTAVSADLDDDRGWEVDVLGTGTTSYTVQVDAGTGRVLGKETDRDDDDRNDDTDDRRALKGATVDARQAAEAASAKGVVTSVSLDDDDRATPAWDVDTVNGDWRVDLKTAQVTADDDGQDDRDDADDRDDRAEAGDHPDDADDSHDD
ncbi:PepSY domain-containing protein [Streptomyces sp. NPDC046316]|uniref:PepSY domain-containing protein n=1 Tax=Streptomyces sp. NPDC046316 TaxID=3154494 RepID=UPI00340D0930